MALLRTMAHGGARRGGPGGDVPAGAAQVEPQITLSIEPSSWRERAALLMDHDSLGPALREEGYRWAGNAEIYVAEIVPGVGQPALILFDAGQGAFSQNFWPASSVKLLAAVAALEYIGSWGGFTGDARITGSLIGDRTTRSIYEPAIVRSDNCSYDLLVKIAGLDFINLEFAPAHGLDSVTIGSAFTDLNPRSSPSYVLNGWVPVPEDASSPHPPRILELPVRTSVPARSASYAYRSNNLDLFDLGEVMRRVLLDAEVPDEHRFSLADDDVAGLTAALCTSEPAHYRAGATEVFGEDALVCGKSGWWERTPEEEEGEEEKEPSPPPCTDVALITDPDTGRRVLLAATGGCSGSGLAALAAPALRAVDRLRGTPLQLDAGADGGVAAGGRRGPDGRRRRPRSRLGAGVRSMAVRRWSHPGGTVGSRRRWTCRMTGRHLLVVRGFSTSACRSPTGPWTSRSPTPDQECRSRRRRSPGRGDPCPPAARRRIPSPRCGRT